MSLSQELFEHARDLLLRSTFSDTSSNLLQRRAISAAYYALFHHLNEVAADLIAPNVSTVINRRIQRWFDHAEMKRVCGRVAKRELEQPLRGLLGPSASDDLQLVCSTFIRLQADRHNADYDQGFSIDHDEALDRLISVGKALSALRRLAGSAELNIFVLSLLLWKNWEKERP